jgi:hypothetical protein
VLHFHKLGQQRKTVHENEGTRPAKYCKSKENTTIFDTTHKQVHIIDLDGCGPPENLEKNFKPSWLESESRIQTKAEEGRETKTNLYIACFVREIQTIAQGIVPSY